MPLGTAVVPGWRDQWCPVCGAGPFVLATMHVVRVHGITKYEARRRWGVLASETYRGGTWERLAGGEPDSTVPTVVRAKGTNERRARWLKSIAAERAARGDDRLIARMASRWKV